MMPKLYLFRHGLATKSAIGYGEEIVSASLLPQGLPAINKLGEYLSTTQVDYFVSSLYPRCLQTAEIVSKKTGEKYQTDERLNEYHNISFEEFKRKITYFLQFIEEKKYQNVWICTHVAVIMAIKKLVVGEDVLESDLFSNLPLPGALTVISEKITEEIDFNK